MFENVRVATLEDIDLIMGLASRFLAASKYKNMVFEEHLRPVIENFVTSPLHEKIIILHGDKGMIVGMVSPLLFVGPKVASEIAWWVEPEHRKTNVGTELLEAFEQWARNVDCSLIVMDAQNDKLGKYYESKGYKPTSFSYMKEV